MVLNLAIQKDTGISIHQQLVTQLSLQIAAGQLPEGAKLPSVRALSMQLGIHYNTCLAVYKELTVMGLVIPKKGSGVVVNQFKKDAIPALLHGQGLHQLVSTFVQVAQQQGYQWTDVETALQLAWSQKKAKRAIAFADVHPDILPVFQAELEEALGQPVKTLDMSISGWSGIDLETLYLVSRYHHRTLKSGLAEDDWDNICLIDVGPSPEAVAQIRALPEGKLMTIVSYSSIVLQMAESVISCMRGHEILVSALLWQDGQEAIMESMACSDLIFCDRCCIASIKTWTAKPVQVIRLIAETEIDRIKQFIR